MTSFRPSHHPDVVPDGRLLLLMQGEVLATDRATRHRFQHAVILRRAGQPDLVAENDLLQILGSMTGVSSQ